MALVLADRVQQTGTANTTVSFTLSGSVTGFQSFSVIGDTNTTYYAATDASGNWEVGIGTYSTTGPTLTRTTILSSSNSGSAVTFSGTVNVFVTYPSEKSVNYDAADNVGIGTTSPTARLNIVDATSQDALRITQTGGGNALVVQDESPESTPFVVDTTGRLITGATQAYTNYLDGFANTARNPTVQFNGTSLSTASSSLTNWASADSPPLLVLAKSKSGTVGTMTSTFSVGDVAGAIQFSASDNTNFIPTALIEAQIDGTPGTGDMPGRLVFSTTADGGSLPTERMRIDSSGNVGIGISSGAGIVAPLQVSVGEPGGETIRLAWNTGTTTQGFSSIGFSTTQTATQPNALIRGEEIDTSDYRGNLLFATRATNVSTDAPIERMRIDSVGNVGIGSTTSTHKLSIFSANAGDNLSLLNLAASATATGGGAAQATFVASSNLMTINLGASDALVISNEGTEATRVTSGGGFLISRTAVTSPVATDGNVFSGTYTPTLTNTTNIAASTPYATQYMRVGNVVTVSGRLNIDPTTSGAASELGISLPITSDITSGFQCAGTGAIHTTTTEVSTGGILGDTTNNRATFRFVAGGTAARDYGFTFTYLVN